jgi:RecA/RadA recombinase
MIFKNIFANKIGEKIGVLTQNKAKNIFANKIGEKIGVFYSKQS